MVGEKTECCYPLTTTILPAKSWFLTLYSTFKSETHCGKKWLRLQEEESNHKQVPMVMIPIVSERKLLPLLFRQIYTEEKEIHKDSKYSWTNSSVWHWYQGISTVITVPTVRMGTCESEVINWIWVPVQFPLGSLSLQTHLGIILLIPKWITGIHKHGQCHNYPMGCRWATGDYIGER